MLVYTLLFIRICGAIFLGWWLMAIPFLLGLNGWGFYHSGLFVLILPFFAALAYWLLGWLPIVRLTRWEKVRR